MKAIALVSGGLDSTLAANLIQQQGIEVLALNFKTPFCLCDRKTSQGCSHAAKTTADNLGVELKMVNIGDEFLQVIRSPRHGYGSNMNPCIDCRILKFKKAKEYMQETGAAFILTGEVLGQRPMSQHRQALMLIEKESGLEGLVLRPLSAQLLPETIPERQGWVDRDKLLSFNGRSRKPQFSLAKELNIQDYSCPAGGCLLTDPEFSKRIKDLMLRGKLDFNNVNLLKLGRHFRLSQDSKLIVGRDEKENQRLINLAQDGDYLFGPTQIAGPTALGRGYFNAGLVDLAVGIVCSYCDLDGKQNADISLRIFPNAQEKIINALPLERDKFAALRIGS